MKSNQIEKLINPHLSEIQLYDPVDPPDVLAKKAGIPTHKIIKLNGHAAPAAIIGMGGGITMDIAKAVSNLLTNGGKSEDYQTFKNQ